MCNCRCLDVVLVLCGRWVMFFVIFCVLLVIGLVCFIIVGDCWCFWFVGVVFFLVVLDCLFLVEELVVVGDCCIGVLGYWW